MRDRAEEKAARWAAFIEVLTETLSDLLVEPAKQATRTPEGGDEDEARA